MRLLTNIFTGVIVVGMTGLTQEIITAQDGRGVQKRYAVGGKEEWSREWELNPRPADYESAALPLSYLGSAGSAGEGARGLIPAFLL
jgi:hypothetical protein